MRECPAMKIQTLIVTAVFAFAMPAVVQAQPVSVPQVSTPDPARFYLLSFTDAPIAEVAEAVITGGLNQDFVLDPAVEGTLSFQVEGAFTEQALLAEFGTALLDQDAALIRARDGSLSIVARDNLVLSTARGASLIALPVAAIAPSSDTRTPTRREPIAYGQDRWWDGTIGGLLLFLGGAMSGAAALFAGQWIWWRRSLTAAPSAPPMLQLANARPIEMDREMVWAEDNELVIPRFVAPRDGV